MEETQVQFLGQEDLLEKEMATYSNILVWKIPWTEEPGGLQSMRLCPTLSDPMDCSLTGSSVHGIFQARVLEWDAIAFSSNI